MTNKEKSKKMKDRDLWDNGNTADHGGVYKQGWEREGNQKKPSYGNSLQLET